jgi:SAM-dependent methyltransferase
MALAAIDRTGYTYKASSYSSHAALVDSLPPQGRGKRVLDIGCASGYLAEILAGRGYEAVGIERPGAHGDSFPESVELVEADLEAGLPPLRRKFSYVICGDILEHLRDPAKMLTQIAAILEPDGQIVASLPNSGHLHFRLTVLSGRFPQNEKGLFDRTHLHFYMWKGWSTLFENAGFQIDVRKVTGVPFGLALSAWDGTAAIRALEWIGYMAARLWPALFAYQFVITARRRNT